MNIVVCIKQVPDTTEIKIDPVKNTLIRTGVPSIMNPFDKNALETGLQLKDRYGGKVTVISMGPPQAKAVLREALAMGADEAYLVTDRAFGGSDTYATSYILSQAIQMLGGFDVILGGKQAIDGDTGQTAPSIAEHLGAVRLTYILDMESRAARWSPDARWKRAWRLSRPAFRCFVPRQRRAINPDTLPSRACSHP